MGAEWPERPRRRVHPPRLALGREDFGGPQTLTMVELHGGGAGGLSVRLDLQEPVEQFDELAAVGGAEAGQRR